MFNIECKKIICMCAGYCDNNPIGRNMFPEYEGIFKDWFPNDIKPTAIPMIPIEIDGVEWIPVADDDSHLPFIDDTRRVDEDAQS